MIDLDKTIFNIAIESKIPTAGSLLVAEPFLREEYFNHAVVCLADYLPGQSAMGLVMNKPTGYELSELVSGIDTESGIEVYCGGPMSTDRLFYLHRIPQFIENSTQIAENLYIGGDFEDVCSYISEGLPCEGNIRFFVGYSGWEAGQLHSELLNHVWGVSDIPQGFNPLKGEEDRYWHRVVRRMDRRYRGWAYMPMNPSDN